jgi:hypothetical protein
MHPLKTNVQADISRRPRVVLRIVLLIFFLMICSEARQLARAEAAAASSVADCPLTIQQVVDNLVRANHDRAHALRAYQGTRTYRVEYRGFPSNRSAEMVVTVEYRAPGIKEFTIESATGSKIIIDRVLKKLLDAEKEAQTERMQTRTALNTDNYNFTMVGFEGAPAGSMYVLVVEPKTKDKFLYRARVWVDAKDFALVRIKGEPATNPSFWIKNSEIEQLYKKVGKFWLPASNHSISFVRLGGRAELTIEYGSYKTTSVDETEIVSKPNPLEDSRRVLDVAEQRSKP